MVSRVNPALAAPKLKRSDDPVVARGQDAWEQLQEDAPRRRALSRGPGDKARERREQSQTMHRRWWLEIGRALAIGRRFSDTDHAYYAWIKSVNFDGMARNARRDAVWLVANIGGLGEIPDGLATPSTIRQWANKRRAAASRPANGGYTATEDLIAIQKAAALLREAARDARRSMKSADEAARLLHKVNTAIKRREGV